MQCGAQVLDKNLVNRTHNPVWARGLPTAGKNVELPFHFKLLSLKSNWLCEKNIFTSFCWRPSLFIESQSAHQMPIGIDTPSTLTSWLAANSHNSPDCIVENIGKLSPNSATDLQVDLLGRFPFQLWLQQVFYTCLFHSFPYTPLQLFKCIQRDFRNPLIIFVVTFFFSSVTFFRSNSGMASGKQARPWTWRAAINWNATVQRNIGGGTLPP